MVSKDWLVKLNKEFHDIGIEHKYRPWKALDKYSKEFNIPVNLQSDIAKEIFEWFKIHTKFDSQKISVLYETIYFYDSEFWLLTFPQIYGQVKLDIFASLEMPNSLKQKLLEDKRELYIYTEYWKKSLDYGLKLKEMYRFDMDSSVIDLISAASQDLRSAVSDLKGTQLNSSAVFSSRMAVEKFFKAYINLKQGLTKQRAKKINHDLSKCFEEFIKIAGFINIENIEEKLSIFPRMDERYNKLEISREDLWDCFKVAQLVGTIVMKECAI